MLSRTAPAGRYKHESGRCSLARQDGSERTPRERHCEDAFEPNRSLWICDVSCELTGLQGRAVLPGRPLAVCAIWSSQPLNISEAVRAIDSLAAAKSAASLWKPETPSISSADFA